MTVVQVILKWFSISLHDLKLYTIFPSSKYQSWSIGRLGIDRTTANIFPKACILLLIIALFRLSQNVGHEFV